MDSFILKVEKFIEIFIEYNGYVKVLEGLKNTLIIAVLGLLIGIVIGILIATVRVIPKYKILPRILNGICSVYVGLFRGGSYGRSVTGVLLCNASTPRHTYDRCSGRNTGIRFK